MITSLIPVIIVKAAVAVIYNYDQNRFILAALHKRKCDLAHELHIGLMMDYVSEVNWKR